MVREVTAATPGVMGLASSTGINIDLIVRVLGSGGAITVLKKIGNDTQAVQNKINNTTNQLGEQISITQNKLPKFQMQWLSMMFMGMQIQRTFGSFFQDAIKSIDKIEGYTGAWHKSTMKLNAAWEYFKFVFLDTLAQSPLFQYIVDLVVRLIDYVSENEWLMNLTIFGTILMWIAGWLLFNLSMLMLFSLSLKMFDFTKFGAFATQILPGVASGLLLIAIVLAILFVDIDNTKAAVNDFGMAFEAMVDGKSEAAYLAFSSAFARIALNALTLGAIMFSVIAGVLAEVGKLLNGGQGAGFTETYDSSMAKFNEWKSNRESLIEVDEMYVGALLGKVDETTTATEETEKSVDNLAISIEKNMKSSTKAVSKYNDELREAIRLQDSLGGNIGADRTP